jgi:hypothetical protein
MDVEATQVIGHLGFRIDRVGIALRKELDDLRAEVQALRDEVIVARRDIQALAAAIANRPAGGVW